MPPWCTCLFYIGWLRNVQRFITSAEPLYESLNPLFCDVFAADVVCARPLLLWSIKSHDVDLSVFCLLPQSICDLTLEVIKKFQAHNCRLPHWKKTVPWKFPEIRPDIFGRMVSAQDSFFTIFASSP